MVNSPTWVNGVRGNALSFNGSSQKVTTGAATVTVPCSASAWVYLTARQGVGSSILDLNGSTSFRAEQYQSNDVGITQYGVADYTFSPSYSVSLLTWTHLAIVNVTGASTLYVNGNSQGTISQTLSCSRNYIGGSLAADFLPGIIDDVRVYNRALTAQDVYMLYLSDNRIRNAVMNNVQFK